MKKNFISLLLAIMASTSVIFASDIRVDGISYNIGANNAIVASYTCSGNVVIPDSIIYDGQIYYVTGIGENAFRGCTSLTSITIPKSVKRIANNAFYDCDNLTSVHISDISAWCDISFANWWSNPLIYANNLCLEDEIITDLVIPNGVTKIKKSAFYGCYSIAAVTIPASITIIEDYAFEGCKNLTSVYISDIAAWCNIAFGNATANPLACAHNLYLNDTKISDLIIPNGVESVSDYAFYGCYGLHSLEFSIGVTNIGNNAFNQCLGLTNVVIPNSITSIGGSAFSSCSSLASIAIPTSVTNIGEYAFSGTGITSLTIPNNVINIGTGAFAGCFSLDSVSLPNNMTSVPHYMFNSCWSLASITLPNSVISIGEWAFAECTSLVFISMSPQIRTINQSAFESCSSLTSVSLPDSLKRLESSAFVYCSSLEKVYCRSLVPPTLLGSVFIETSPSLKIFVPCGCLNDYKTAKEWKTYASRIQYAPASVSGIPSNENAGIVIVPESTICDVMEIEAIPNYGYHFTQWSDGSTENPRIVDPAEEITYIAEFVVDKSGNCGDDMQLTWQYDSESKRLTISGSGNLITNKRYGVEAVNEMTELIVEDGVGVIGDSAFANITTLTKVTLGKDVRKINNLAFFNDYNLTSIYNYRQTPPTAFDNTFDEVDKYACTVYVLSGSENMYRSATGWRDFYNITAMVESSIEGTLDIQPISSHSKLIRNGNVYILTGDKTYTITGIEVK